MAEYKRRGEPTATMRGVGIVKWQLAIVETGTKARLCANSTNACDSITNRPLINDSVRMAPMLDVRAHYRKGGLGTGSQRR